ncbi:hypothetical protein RRSWK_05573 [Rhodopirellula sp. SWK7]|nr:hypothetical protein RRSWK_05573 [Rhodopirellula sp. SWK7]
MSASSDLPNTQVDELPARVPVSPCASPPVSPLRKRSTRIAVGDSTIAPRPLKAKPPRPVQVE